MKPTDPPPPQAPAGRGPSGPRARRPGLHGGYPIRDEASAARYDDGVVHRHHEPGDEDPLHNEDVAHEHSDVDIRAIITSAVVLTVVVIVSQVLMYVLFGWFEREAAANEPPVSPLSRPATEMPRTITDPHFSQGVAAPQLLTNEPMALEKFLADQNKRLHGFGWIDEKTGVAHMPIDDAKKLILERGLPVRAETTVTPSLGTRLPAAGEASGGSVITVPLPEPPAGGTPAPAAKPHGGH